MRSRQEGWAQVEPPSPGAPPAIIDRGPLCQQHASVRGTFQDDPVAIDNVGRTGASGLIWGSDYPHMEGTYPHSRETVARLAKGLESQDDVERVFRTNAAELFHFSDEVLTTPV